MCEAHRDTFRLHAVSPAAGGAPNDKPAIASSMITPGCTTDQAPVIAVEVEDAIPFTTRNNSTMVRHHRCRTAGSEGRRARGALGMPGPHRSGVPPKAGTKPPAISVASKAQRPTSLSDPAPPGSQRSRRYRRVLLRLQSLAPGKSLATRVERTSVALPASRADTAISPATGSGHRQVWMPAEGLPSVAVAAPPPRMPSLAYIQRAWPGRVRFATSHLGVG